MAFISLEEEDKVVKADTERQRQTRQWINRNIIFIEINSSYLEQTPAYISSWLAYHLAIIYADIKYNKEFSYSQSLRLIIETSHIQLEMK